MQSLQIFRLKTGISPRHFERRMAKCLLKMEDTSSPPNVIQRERMTKCAQAPFRRIES